ncbi:MAG TPA: hypothetical protein V6D17_16320 [Candidatus Obscuribacterales bacterium]
MKKPTLIAIALTFVFNVPISPANACAFANEPYFTYTIHPDFPLNKYASGKLGILHNTYARSYLLVAYRYLAGKPLTKDEQEQLDELWSERFEAAYASCEADTSAWLKLRATVPGVAKLDRIDTERPISSENEYQTYCNAQTSAFTTAANTLKRLIDKYGAGSAQVKEWVAAQDQVFSNCGTAQYSNKIPTVKIPAELADTYDATMKMERAYQIAAANFYAQKFEEARQDFEAIARDKESPWRELSAYLAIRAMIRQAMLAKEINQALLVQAGVKVKELLASPSYAALKEDLKELGSYVASRVAPEEHLNELLKESFSKSSVAEITKTIDNFIDPDNSATEVKYAAVPASLKKNEIIDWMLSFQSTDDEGTNHAIAKWKQTRSLPWLVAAITGAAADDPNAKALMAAARQEKSSAAKWTLFYHINRLESDMDKVDAVRASLDKVLAAPPSDLPPGSLNELKLLRLPLSRNLDEFVSFGIQRPLAICSDGGTPQLPDDKEEMEGKIKTTLVFTPEAANVINNKLPLSVMRQLATKAKLPADLRNNLAWSAWVRAVLIGDDGEAQALARIAQPLNKAKSKYFADYLAAAAPEMKKIAATRLMLHFSSANPNVTAGQLLEDDYGDASGWWWSKSPISVASDYNANSEDASEDMKPDIFDPSFITEVQKKQALQQLNKLKAVETAPTYFAKTILAFARAHPSDPRVPEMLHYGVKCTRYGAVDDTTQGLSKQMYSLLHSKYKGNPWTKKTPYWF